MLILPSEHRYRALPWVPPHEWREPSLAQPKDQLGNQNRTRFRFIAKGVVPWVGWCDSREDADAFLNAMLRCTYLGEVVPPSIWRLPTPNWHPDVGAEVWWAAPTFLTSTAALPTFTSPSDWNNSSNSIECIGAGASGASGSIPSASGHTTGGGGGEYGITTNVSFAMPGTSFVTYQIGTGGTSVVFTGSSGGGVAGGDTWWNGATQAAAVLGCKGGTAGAAAAGNTSGGAGGTGGVGTTHKAGGRGGNLTGASGGGASGGGGAGGSTAAGSNGGDSSSTSSVNTAGGAGDGGSGGAGGSAGGGTGGVGQEWDSTHGSGGGGGGKHSTSINSTAGPGGNYGAGGGGAADTTNASLTATSGAGTQGIIVVIYTVAITTLFRRTLNTRAGSRG